MSLVAFNDEKQRTDRSGAKGADRISFNLESSERSLRERGGGTLQRINLAVSMGRGRLRMRWPSLRQTILDWRAGQTISRGLWGRSIDQ